MARLEIKRQMGQGDIAAVSELLDIATATDGHRPLGEHQWLDLVHGGRHGFAGLVAWEPGHDHPVGYAQLTREHIRHAPVRSGSQPEATDADLTSHGPTWALEYVVDPHHRTSDPGIGTTLVQAALTIVGQEGGGHVHLWVPHPTGAHDSLAKAVGLKRGRELRQLRRALPMDTESTVDSKGPIDVRPFVRGRDEQAWLNVNNRAFHWHPEQGGWDLERLLARQNEAWFDPEGLLLHERDGQLAGSCWTKIHPDHDPPLGEIYVLAVDPGYQRLGLGRSLVLAGLDWLSSQGLTTGMLYVDGDNDAANGLYQQLGFTVDHVDRAYVGDFAAGTSPD